MIVRMTTQLVWYGREIMPGETVDLPDNVALRYIATKQADRIEEPPTPTQPAIETATRDRALPNAMRDFKPLKRR
jgi:hypothetical protein